MSYGPDEVEPFRRAASMIDKIFKGTKPADIPVEQPTKFEFVVNLRTAKQIGRDDSAGGARPAEQADQVTEENQVG